MIINCISGPRNISTAMMYAFAQHSKVKVIDEPFYACYLKKTGIDHPGRVEILGSMSHDQHQVLDQVSEFREKHAVVFLKNMAHHHEALNWEYLLSMQNFFLIRDPKELILSFSKVINEPTIQDIGLKHELALAEYIVQHTGRMPLIRDSNEILADPESGLKSVCSQINLTFEKEMLSWEKGGLTEDGIWAKYWYKNVHESTGFLKQKSIEQPLLKKYQSLYKEAMGYYEQLKEMSCAVKS